jgi:hypothetical protein
MATLYVTEYQRSAHDGAGYGVMTGLEPATRTQVVTISGASAASVALVGKFIRVHTDTACCIKFGAASVTATTSDARLAANQTEFFGIRNSPDTYVAVIAST